MGPVFLKLWTAMKVVTNMGSQRRRPGNEMQKRQHDHNNRKISREIIVFLDRGRRILSSFMPNFDSWS